MVISERAIGNKSGLFSLSLSLFVCLFVCIFLLLDLHPESIIAIAKIISLSVFGATLPKPTETKPVKTK